MERSLTTVRRVQRLEADLMPLEDIRAAILRTYHGQLDPNDPQRGIKTISWDQCLLWLGRELGLSQPILSDALVGSGYLRADKLQRLAQLLNCNISRLLVLAHIDGQQLVNLVNRE